MDSIIKTSGLSYRYPEETALALSDVSLEIERGSFVAVLGHNGSGKSTLAKHFNAILLPTEGVCEVAGIDTREADRLYDIRRIVGMVFQNPDNQIVATIVEEDVAFGLENLGVEPLEIRKRVDDALEAVGMGAFKQHAPHQLSGGQKQRVAIAGVLAMRTDCIILDEPTAMLDPRGRSEVIEAVRKLNREFGVTVVMITHFMDEAVQCDRVVVIDGGKVVLDDAPAKVFSHISVLKKMGLDVPQVTEFADEMRRCGVNLPEGILDEETCASEIKKLILAGRNTLNGAC